MGLDHQTPEEFERAYYDEMTVRLVTRQRTRIRRRHDLRDGSYLLI